MPQSRLHFLVADSETREARERRRESVGFSAGRGFANCLEKIEESAAIDFVCPADGDAALPGRDQLTGYDAVFFTGSPLHMYDDTPEVRGAIAFMRRVFESGTPAFGSCAGLQLAVVAAGGSVRPAAKPNEAGFARRIVATPAGCAHPLLAGRPPTWDAPAIHSDEVETLPAGGTLLAGNRATAVQAAEIRHAGGIFWGVQYHPELAMIEVAAALRRDAATLIEQGLARGIEDVEAVASLVDALGRDPGRDDILWRLGLDAEVAETPRRTRELRNFIDHLVWPTARTRRARVDAAADA